MRIAFFLLMLTGLAHFGFTPDSLPYAHTAGCPTVYVSCPDNFEFDKPMTFTAPVSGVEQSVKLNYRWEVSAGKIIEGQGTSSIKVMMTNQDGTAITTTVEVEGFPSSCANKASCSLMTHQRKEPDR